MESITRQQGFGLIGLLILVIALGTACLAGWRVYNERYGSNEAYQCGINTETLKSGCVPAAGER